MQNCFKIIQNTLVILQPIILLFCTRLCLALLANSEDHNVSRGRLCAKDNPAAMEENFTLQLRLRTSPPSLRNIFRFSSHYEDNQAN